MDVFNLTFGVFVTRVTFDFLSGFFGVRVYCAENRLEVGILLANVYSSNLRFIRVKMRHKIIIILFTIKERARGRESERERERSRTGVMLMNIFVAVVVLKTRSVSNFVVVK